MASCISVIGTMRIAILAFLLRHYHLLFIILVSMSEPLYYNIIRNYWTIIFLIQILTNATKERIIAEHWLTPPVRTL